MKIDVIDSHTGGEPARIVIGGWPEPAGISMEEKLHFVKENQDHIRQAVVCEPRGHDAVVGALLTAPVNEGSICGVIYFNDVGYLGMCGHATMCLAETLKFMGKIQSGKISIDTPVGTVEALIDDSGLVTVRNVTPRLMKSDLEINVPGLGTCLGDVVYGGNWFYLVSSLSLSLDKSNIDELLRVTKDIRAALVRHGVTGDDGHQVDHIELFDKPVNERAHSKNFVLCPGNAYDRSPCGTGTSAKMYSLFKKNLLQIDELWVQESITGSLFDCRLVEENGAIVPLISSKAFVTSTSTLHFNELDPFCWGIA